MQLTKHTDFSLRVLIYLALQAPEQRVTNSEIAEQFAIPKNHLIKVVHELGKLGYIVTIRGKGGGILLKMPANTINIAKVIQDMEPTLELINCEKPICPLLPSCALIGVLAQARTAFIDVLAQYTLADLIKQPETMEHLIQWRPATNDA